MNRNNKTLRNILIAAFAIFAFPILFNMFDDLIIGIFSLIGIGLAIAMVVGLPMAIIGGIVKIFKLLKNHASASNDLDYQNVVLQKDDYEEPAAVQKEPEPVKPAPVRQDFIESFGKLNLAIEDAEISAELENAQKYLKQLNALEKEYPEVKEKTKRLYTYYLPMLENILKDYARIADVPSQGNEIKEYEERLLKTFQLINSAMKSIAAELYQKYHGEMNADMEVLESLLRKDGLVEEMTLTAKQ